MERVRRPACSSLRHPAPRALTQPSPAPADTWPGWRARKSAGAASQAVSSFNQRWFGGRQIQCEFWDGQTDFKCVVVRRGVLLLLLLLLLRVCPRGDVRWVRPLCARTTLTLCLRVAHVLPHDCRAKDGGAVDEEERLDAFGRWLEGDEG